MGQNTGNFILITSTNFPEGGPGANYLHLFCRGLKANGAEVKAYLLKGHAFGNSKYTGPRTAYSPYGIRFTYLGFRQRSKNFVLKLADQMVSFFRLHLLLISLAGKRRKDTILLYNSNLFFNLPIHLIAKATGIRLVKFAAEIIDKSQFGETFIGSISKAAYMSNFKYLNKMSDKLIVFSHYLKSEFLRMGFDEQKILVQPNLTDFEFWEAGKCENRFTIGYSGAPYMKDGLNDLMEAISILSSRDIKASLLIVGDATFGKTLIPDLKKECHKLGINDKVTFTGLVESMEVKVYLSQCDILAITRPDTVQTRAGFPTKLGEYFALRKPILATRFGDMERYFTDGTDIVFAECGNPASIAQKLEWMMQNSEELEKIAQRGYSTAYDLLGYKSSMKKILKFLTTDQE